MAPRSANSASRSPREILEQATTIAVVGASRDPLKSAGAIPQALQHYGFRIIPVNPHTDALYGVRCYHSLLDVREPVDVVDVFRPSADAAAIARQAVTIGARALWLQQGIVSAEARTIATAAGLDYVEDLCIAVERAKNAIVKGPV